MTIESDVQKGVIRRPAAVHALTALARRPWFAYGTILLLQIDRMWKVWEYHELSGGDTCAYFLSAYRWFTIGRGDVAWSPLYTLFYGSLLHLTRDAAVVTTLHRLLIALAATALVLAVMRRMLPASLAWLIAAWWAWMPINFDTMYEVHLFSALPILLAWLVILSWRGPWGRGTAIGILLLSAFTVRNEMLVGAGLLAIVCCVWEVRQGFIAPFPPPSQPSPGTPGEGESSTLPYVVLGYLVPIGLSLGIVAWFFSHSTVNGADLEAEMHGKHVVNMGQVYAFGYQQRHPKWKHNPWVDFEQLSQREFGSSMPTFAQMIRRNPRAYAKHVFWNYRLVPNGLQMMLFGATSGERDPDYAGLHLGEMYPLPLSIAALLVVVVGSFLLWREWKKWWATWIRPRVLGWLAMLCVAAVCVFVVIPTQRPRPSYLFGLTIFIMCCIGACLMVIFSRWRWVRKLELLMPAAMLAVAWFAPGAYGNRQHHDWRPMYDDYELLRPYQNLMTRRDVGFVGLRPVEMCNYLGLAQSDLSQWHDYTIFSELKPDQSLADFLNERRITVLELAQSIWYGLESEHPGALREFIATGGETGWKLVGLQDSRQSKWMLFARFPTSSGDGTGVAIGSLPDFVGEFGGWRPLSGWLPLEGPYPDAKPPTPSTPLVRWGLAPASMLQLTDERGGDFVLRLSGWTPLQNQRIAITLDGRSIGAYPIGQRGFTDVEIPLTLSFGPHRLELSYSIGQDVGGGIIRGVLFRRVEINPRP